MLDPIVLAVLLFVLLLAILAAGVHIAVGLMIVAFLGFLFSQSNINLISFTPYSTAHSFLLTAIPLFIFTGEVVVRCGISERLYRGASKWLAWAPGGLLHSNIGSCAMFAAISGSSAATAATIGTVALPALKERHYDVRLTLGSLAGGGTLGILIPPSMTMIVFGMLAEASVGRLFAGGVIPGLILSLMFMTYIGIRAVRNPQLAPKEVKFAVRNLILSFKDFWPAFILSAIILGGIFGGLVTPTEAAALGASAALIMALGFRRLNWQMIRESLASSLRTTCMVMFIVMAANMFAAFLAVTRVPASFALLVVQSGLSNIAILIAIYLLYLFLGCFIDGLSTQVMTVPTILPVIVALGFDPIWFGVILVMLVEVGALTPPMGINLFVIQGLSKRSLADVIIGSVPFFFIIILGIVLLTMFPSLVLWLPTLFFG
jgi:tripartite ATP-independent transporter DctM subunit